MTLSCDNSSILHWDDDDGTNFTQELPETHITLYVHCNASFTSSLNNQSDPKCHVIYEMKSLHIYSDQHLHCKLTWEPRTRSTFHWGDHCLILADCKRDSDIRLEHRSLTLWLLYNTYVKTIDPKDIKKSLTYGKHLLLMKPMMQGIIIHLFLLYIIL